MCQKYYAGLVLYLLLRLSLSAQAYSPELANLLEMKTIVIRLSDSLTLREELFSQREADSTERENFLNAREAAIIERENSTSATEKTFKDLNTSLTIALKKKKAADRIALIAIAAAVTEGVIIILRR